jgi:hypothetical protein
MDRRTDVIKFATDPWVVAGVIPQDEYDAAMAGLRAARERAADLIAEAEARVRSVYGFGSGDGIDWLDESGSPIGHGEVGDAGQASISLPKRAGRDLKADGVRSRRTGVTVQFRYPVRLYDKGTAQINLSLTP